MAELLLELFSEEIPARMQQRASEDLKKAFEQKLLDKAIEYSSIDAFVTPRRLTIAINGVVSELPDKVTEKKGPKVDAPEKAIEGFLRSNNLTLEKLEKRSTPKGEFYFAVIEEKGGSVDEYLKDIVESSVHGLKWPKSMLWGNHDFRWVRPLQTVCCIFDGKILPITVGGIEASDTTRGHRFLNDNELQVSNIADYKSKLKKANVLLDRDERIALIQNDAEKIAKKLGVSVYPDQGLLEEVAGLVEYPVVLSGKIDEQFMKLPKEVMISSMRSHQKYFSVVDEEDNLAPYFIFVSNMKTKDNEAQIIAGNERVLRARLSDALFFWEQDQMTKLESRVEGLEKIIFHESLGTVKDKVDRIKAIAKLSSVWIPHASLLCVERAALLCKTDLNTLMVGEFADLQGVMGGYYARNDGENEDVVQAILSHYKPQGPSDTCPKDPVSIAVSLADKVDTLVGLFIIGEKPTGSKDPFALRRAALGVIRIILENNLSIPLKILFEKSIRLYPKRVFKTQSNENLAKKIIKKAVPVLSKEEDKEQRIAVKQKAIISELLQFFAERLKVSLKEENVRHDLISAVFDGGNEDDLLRLVQRVRSLEHFVTSDDGVNLLAAYRRATNIVRIEEKKDGFSYSGKPNKELLTQKEEKTLYRALKVKADPIAKAVKNDDFETVMKELTDLREPIDNFFDQVTVNSENSEIRANRLKILSQIRTFLNDVANFDKIEG